MALYANVGAELTLRIGDDGTLSPHGAPITLPTRPIHMATDVASKYILVAFNNPSALRVYRINADAGGRSVPVVGSGKREPTLQMRAPSGRQPGPVFEHRTSAGWQRESTIRVGVDVYQSQVPALGDWALVQLTSSSSSSGPGINWGFLGGGIALLVVAGLIVVVRVRRAAAVES